MFTFVYVTTNCANKFLFHNELSFSRLLLPRSLPHRGWEPWQRLLCFVVELIILVQCGALWAAAAQVKLGVLRLKIVGHTGAFYQFGLTEFHVIHVATACAQKMCMWRGVGIKTAVALINGQLQCGTLFGEQLQGVVHRGFRQGRYGGVQCRVNFVGGGVRTVLYQVGHHRHALQRGLDAMGLKIAERRVRFHSSVICNDYNYDYDAKVRT